MKKTELLHADISAVVAQMGHTDMLTVGDCGLPIPMNVRCIDLALKKGVPTFLETLQAILSELCVEEVTIASEMSEENKELLDEIQHMLRGIKINEIPHASFKEKTKESRAIVRTGEYIPYANIILHAGVTF